MKDEVVDLGAVELPAREAAPSLGEIAKRAIIRKLIGLAVLGGLGVVAIGALLLLGTVVNATRVERPGEVAFRAADQQVSINQGQVAAGNTAEAAERFSKRLKLLQAVSFEGGKDESTRLSLSGGEFLTFCQVQPDSVAFLVHVPQLKAYKGESREALLGLAWSTAQEVTAELRQAGDRRLAVGLRGAVLYGALAAGQGAAERPGIFRQASSVSTDELVGFFAPAATTAAAATPGE